MNPENILTVIKCKIRPILLTSAFCDDFDVEFWFVGVLMFYWTHHKKLRDFI